MSVEITQTINHVDVYQRPVETLVIETSGPQGPVGPPGSFTFTVAGNSGPSQTINDGNTLTLTSPVSFQQVVMSATDTATFEWPNQSGRVFLASPSDGSAGTPAFRAIVFADLDAVLGTMAQQDANNVAITGGSISGLTSLGVTGNTTLGDANSDTLTINGTAVSIPNGLNIDSDTLVIDATNNRVGIGASPLSPYKLDVANVAAASSDGYYLVRGNRYAGAYIWAEYDDGTSGLPILNLGYRLNAGAPRSSAYISLNASGNLAFGTRSNSFGSAGDNDQMLLIAATGAFIHSFTDAGTNDTQTVLTLRRNSTSTPIANFASRLLWQLESSTTENRDAAALDVLWTTATDATRTSRMDFYTVTSGTLTLVGTLSNTGSTFTSTSSGNNQRGIQGNITLATNSVASIGIMGRITTNSSTPALTNTLTSAPAALWGFLDVSGSNNITEIQSMKASLTKGGANTVTTWKGITVEAPIVGAGAITNAYGLYVDTQTAAANNWAIYTNAGVVRIGGDIDHDGTLVGFFGVAPVVRQALGAWAGLNDAQKLDALRDALTNLGLTSYT